MRQWWIDRGACRTYINKSIERIRRLFKWAVAEELIPPAVYHGLAAVEGLKRGRSDAPEPEEVIPVPNATVDATLPFMTSVLRGMVEVQRLTGMRLGEVCIMRACDLDTTGTVWMYKPADHKTAHHGRKRVIFIGPRAQEIVRPFLRRELTAYLFSPIESVTEGIERRRRNRKTPLSCGNRAGRNRKKNPKRRPRDHFDTQTYGRAIDNAADKAFPPPRGLGGDDLKQWRRDHRWSPNQLRHTYGTEVRREHGLEAAQVLLGHALADVTQVYAERDVAKGVAVAARIG